MHERAHSASHSVPATPEPAHEHAHPSAREYIVVAVVLTILTAAEVAIYYIPQLEAFLIPLLVVLGLGKFVFVVGWYMHLKFDARIFTALFVGGLVLAVATLAGLWALFNGWGG